MAKGSPASAACSNHCRACSGSLLAARFARPAARKGTALAAAPAQKNHSGARLASNPPTDPPRVSAGQRAVIRGTFAMSSATRQTRGQLNMQPPGLNI
jgi:hypothetical protein